MSRRHGRNTLRKMRQQVRDAGLSREAVWIMRKTAQEGLGFNCTFIDDNMSVIIGLAQRAVLAGLATDFTPDMQRRFTTAAEPHRAIHETSLGFALSKDSTNA